MSKSKKIIMVAVLLAAQIALSRFFSIRTPIVKIGFAFIPTCICAIWLGTPWTILLNVLGDIIGATLFPTGAFFIGYTITAAVSGLIYGLLLHNGYSIPKKRFVIRLVLATILVTLVSNIGLNTLWLSITTGKAYIVLLGSRIVKEIVMVPIEILTILFIGKILEKPLKLYLGEDDD